MDPIFNKHTHPTLGGKILLCVLLFWILFAVLATVANAQVDHERFLAAVVTVEATPGRGSNGELGKYQFTAQAWRQHSKQPHDWALGRSSEARLERDRVARAHAKWIEQHVDNPTPYRMALVWNAGLATVQRNGFSDSSVDYAKRVFNVYEAGGAP
jgi:hypothetical protein